MQCTDAFAQQNGVGVGKRGVGHVEGRAAAAPVEVDGGRRAHGEGIEVRG